MCCLMLVHKYGVINSADVLYIERFTKVCPSFSHSKFMLNVCTLSCNFECYKIILKITEFTKFLDNFFDGFLFHGIMSNFSL